MIIWINININLNVAYNSKTSSTTEGIIVVSGGALENVELMGSDVGKYDLKVIVATNSAEAGVTFKDPLAFVFETGLQNNVFFRPKEYLYEAGIFDIAQDNIGQRRGRTGRINPGICRYMYTKKQYDGFKKFKDTDITQNDITTDVLALMTTESYNTVDSSIEFLKDMIEPVDRYRDIIQVAYRNLLDNDFIEKGEGKLNEFGRVCAKFGLYGFQVAKIVIMGYHLGVLKEAIYMGAIIYGVSRMDDLLKKEIDKQVLEERKTRILRNFIHPLGDHISMFKLFVEWLKVPDYQKELWEHTYGIDYLKMNIINYAVLDIANIFLKIKDDVMKLNMFYNADKYKVVLGGSNSNLNILENFIIADPFDIDINSISMFGGAISSGDLSVFDKDIPIDELIKKSYDIKLKNDTLINPNISNTYKGKKQEAKGKKQENKINIKVIKKVDNAIKKVKKQSESAKISQVNNKFVKENINKKNIKELINKKKDKGDINVKSKKYKF